MWLTSASSTMVANVASTSLSSNSPLRCSAHRCSSCCRDSGTFGASSGFIFRSFCRMRISSDRDVEIELDPPPVLSVDLFHVWGLIGAGRDTGDPEPQARNIPSMHLQLPGTRITPPDGCDGVTATPPTTTSRFDKEFGDLRRCTARRGWIEMKARPTTSALHRIKKACRPDSEK